MLRALLTEHALAHVLDALLNHINFEEFVMAGMLLAHSYLFLFVLVVLSNYSDCLFAGDVARSGKDKQQNRWQNVLQVGAPLVLCCAWSVLCQSCFCRSVGRLAFAMPANNPVQ